MEKRKYRKMNITKIGIKLRKFIALNSKRISRKVISTYKIVNMENFKFTEALTNQKNTFANMP